MTMTDFSRPDHARSMHLIGHSAQRGRPGRVQIRVQGGYAHIGLMFWGGVWVVDVPGRRHPHETDYMARGAHFGPQNLHETGPEVSLARSGSSRPTADAGIRVRGIRSVYRPEAVGALVPRSNRMGNIAPGRPRVIQSCDIWVDHRHLIDCTDTNANPCIMEMAA